MDIKAPMGHEEQREIEPGLFVNNGIIRIATLDWLTDNYDRVSGIFFIRSITSCTPFLCYEVLMSDDFDRENENHLHMGEEFFIWKKRNGIK